MSRFLTKILNKKPGENKPKLEVVPKADQTQTTPIPDPTQTRDRPVPHPTQTSTKQSKPIAPEKDFNKRANILEREALPNGLFPGASKAIYDALYLRTLGSINPKRSVQATRKELMKWSGIKNIKTINMHLKRLKELRLVGIKNFTGEHTGSHYEVFLPEEGNPDQTQTSQTSPRPNVDQKLDSDQYQKMVWVGSGKDLENKSSYENAKTSLKTNTKSDDEKRVSDAFSILEKRLDDVVKKITGKGVSKNDVEKWGTLADLLILELEVAASRADGVSSVPAFLTEVLRRQFFAARQHRTNSSAKTTKTKIDTVGKTESGVYEIKPLDEKGREAAIEQLREFAGENFLDDFEKWYTPDDWRWLKGNLKGK